MRRTNMKKNIAIVWGGYSSEKEVSERSAAGIFSFIDKKRYNVYKVKIDRQSWEAEYENNHFPIDKNDFSFSANRRKIVFDFAYITIHGTPGEDGKLQGYLDMLDIPYSTCNVLTSALTFNKFACNQFLKSAGFSVEKSILLKKEKRFDAKQIIETLGLPVFVKPNTGGSSFATTKVKRQEDLQAAIDEAFREAPDVLVERFIAGVEVTCGCFETTSGKTVLPITETVPKNDFFDYNAKYKGEVEEITPARIPDKLTTEIQCMTSKIYDLINASGIIRIDFIIANSRPVVLEVNTTPGMTATSFIPQQVAAANLTMKKVLSEIIDKQINASQSNNILSLQNIF